MAFVTAGPFALIAFIIYLAVCGEISSTFNEALLIDYPTECGFVAFGK